jgi:hypothetical protein
VENGGTSSLGIVHPELRCAAIVVVVWMVRLSEVREVTVVQLLLLIMPVPIPVGVGVGFGAIGDCVVVMEMGWVVWFVGEGTAEGGGGCVWREDCVCC